MANNDKYIIEGEFDPKGLKKGADKAGKELDKLEKGVKGTEKSVTKLEKGFKRVGKKLAGVFAVGAIFQAVKGTAQLTAQFQKFEAVLTNTLGSKSQALKALKNIQKFAADTPFQVTELTQSFVKLANQGFRPTIDEMTKLGDLAASQGKSFDQLTEAIIDAQTGEFERLKEFGIRASKSGDQVKFTFKGVETQAKFTANSIREYVLGLGDAQGVSGGMAAISKTLGGEMSNLQDNFEAFVNNLGQANSGVFSGVIGFFNSLIDLANDFVKTSPVEEIENQQIALNSLVIELADANTNQERRNELIGKIKETYPDFLKNINTEKVTVEELAKRLKEYNEVFFKRIVLQANQSAIEEELKQKADLTLENLKTERDLRQQLVKINKTQNLGLELTGKTLEEQVALIRSNNNAQISSNNLISQNDQANIKLSVSLQSIKARKEEIAEIDKQINGLTSEQIILQQKLSEAEDAASIKRTETKTQEMEDVRVSFDELRALEEEQERIEEENIEAGSLRNLQKMADARNVEWEKLKAKRTAQKEEMKLNRQNDLTNRLANVKSAREGVAIALESETSEATAGLMSSILKSVPFPFNLILAGGAKAMVNGLFSQIAVGKFAHGGIVPGNSTSGDNVPILANSGERVLNIPQQQFMMKAGAEANAKIDKLAMSVSELSQVIGLNQGEQNIIIENTQTASDVVQILDYGQQSRELVKVS